MRIARISIGDYVKYGIIKHDMVYIMHGDPFINPNSAVFDPGSERYPLDQVRLLSPCLPSKIVCLGVNYRPHAKEMNSSLPANPLIFIKPSTAVIGPNDLIVMPHNWKRVDFEGELGVVIGKTAKNVSEDEARKYILGYTCFNDVTERQFQKDDGQWTRGKSFDTFAPIGPWIETEIEADDLKVETFLNGEVRQSARTSELIFGIDTVVSFISGVMTLLPGDVIATGTPAGVGPMKTGDTVEVKIEKIGVLRNMVRE